MGIPILVLVLLLSWAGEAVRLEIKRFDDQGDSEEHAAPHELFLPAGSEALGTAGNDDGPQVKRCRAGLHTYINLGDGGCFRHLLEDGTFVDSDAEAAYKAKFCPFTLPSDAAKRKALIAWQRSAIIGGYPPFAINDLAMSCFLDDVDTVTSKFSTDRFFDINVAKWSGEEFCETMLSLPLMFEAIGFDGPGLLMQDSQTYFLWSFKGKRTNVIEEGLPGPSDGCNGFSTSSSLGSARYGRLALRAVLPTYFRHRYAESTKGMVGKGARALASPLTRFKSSYWQDPVEQVCIATAASPEKLQELYSFANLKTGKLISNDVMERDQGKCNNVVPCNYAADPQTHLGACDICVDPDFPWLDKNLGSCWSGETEFGERCSGNSVEKRTCDCQKAICWYFTSDFAAAMSAVTKSCSI